MNLQQELAQRAPNVDRAWVDDFVTELSLRGADGHAIGGALLEVESHMAERGGNVIEEFGAARDYAASLDLPDTQKFSGREVIRTVAQSVLITLGSWIALAGVAGLFTGEAKISLVAAVALAAATTAVTLALVRWSEPILRWVLEHLVLGSLAATLILAAIGGVVAWATSTTRVFTFGVSPAIATVVGVVMIAAWLSWVHAQRRSAGDSGGIDFPIA